MAPEPALPQAATHANATRHMAPNTALPHAATQNPQAAPPIFVQQHNPYNPATYAHHPYQNPPPIATPTNHQYPMPTGLPPRMYGQHPHAAPPQQYVPIHQTPLPYAAPPVTQPPYAAPPITQPPNQNQHGLHPAQNQSAQMIAQLFLTKMLTQTAPLSANDNRLISACQTLLTTPSATPVPQPQKVSAANNREANLLGWAGLAFGDATAFHQATGNAWIPILATEKNTDRIMYVRQGFVHPIKRKHARVGHALQHGWTVAVAKFEFAPSLHSASGGKDGVGPTAYIFRAPHEIHRTDHQRRLNEEASTVSTSDVLKTKLGDPSLPLTLHDLIHTLQNFECVLVIMFTNRCPLAVANHLIVEALYRNQMALMALTDFQYTFGAEILWQLTKATKTFFDFTASQTELMQNIRPTVCLDWLVRAIDIGHCPTSATRPPLFTRPERRNNPRNNPSGGNPNRNDGKRKRDPPTTTTPFTRKLSTKCEALIKTFRGNDSSRRLPTMAAIRGIANTSSDAELSKALGLETNDCLKYNFYGKCDHPRCHRQHKSKTMPDTHADWLEKALKAHVDSK